MLVTERDIERDARPPTHLRRGYQGRARSQNLSHRRSQFRVEHRGGMLRPAVPTAGALPSSPRRLRCRAPRPRARRTAKFLADVDELREVLDIASGEGFSITATADGAPRRRRQQRDPSRRASPQRRLRFCGFYAFISSHPLPLLGGLRPPARYGRVGPGHRKYEQRSRRRAGASSTPISTRRNGCAHRTR